MAHRTTWLRSDFGPEVGREVRVGHLERLVRGLDEVLLRRRLAARLRVHVLDAGERQELDLALSEEKELVEDAKWVKFFQTYLDVIKRESESYDPLVKVMEEKLKGEADQVADYKAGKGDKLKWVEAVEVGS